MNLNLTLFGEMLTFAILIGVTIKYIWPPIIKAIEERQQKIAEGIEAAKRGQAALEATQVTIFKQLHEAKTKASTLLDQANQRAAIIVEDSRNKAQEEFTKILAQTKQGVAQELEKTKQELKQQTVALVIAATEKLLQQKIDPEAQQKLINQLIAEIAP